MKLTKGKLSKIRNKKNQSAKRFKKTGKGRKTKTFRNRKALNLHNTSLKKYKGGEGAKLSKSKEPVVEPTKSDEAPVVSSTTDVVDASQVEPKKIAPITDVVTEDPDGITTTPDVVGESTVEPTPTTDVVTEAPVEESPTPDLGNPGEGPGSHQELPAPVSEVGADSAEVSSAAKDEMVEEGPTAPAGLENGSDTGSEIGSEDAASVSEVQEPATTEPVEPSQQQQSIGNDISIVAESLDKLAEYISDKIAKKLNLGSGNSPMDLNRDSFNAVANANEALVEA